MGAAGAYQPKNAVSGPAAQMQLARVDGAVSNDVRADAGDGSGMQLAAAAVGFGRIVISGIEAPRLLVNLV